MINPEAHLHTAGPAHEAAYQDFMQVVAKHVDKMPGLELVAVAANALGKMLAMLDQRSVTPEMALEVVARNIERGNQQVVEHILSMPTEGPVQ